MDPLIIYLSDEAYVHNLRAMLKHIKQAAEAAEAARIEQRKAARKARRQKPATT